MKIQPYFEKLEQSEEYKNFKVKYPDAFMAAGFFILDFESGNNVHQIDFFIPSKKKIAAFSLDGEVNVKILDALTDKTPEKLEMKINIDLDALSGILEDEMHNRGMSEEIRKIVAVIQNIQGKKIWNLNCVLTGMEILKSHVEDESKTVLKIEKASFLDIMRKLPAQKAMKQPETKEELKGEISRLSQLKTEIEGEKEKLEKQLTKKQKTPKKRS